MKNIITALVFLFPVLARAQAVTASFDALVSEAGAKQVFSGNILVIKDNAVLYEKSIGYADIEKRIPNTASTAFQIGSITKMFTKILILQLAAEHRLDLADHLGKYIPGFSKEISEQVTIQQLMDHTSGLGDYSQQDGFMEAHESFQSVSDILPLIQKGPLLFPPGTNKEYSNSGYVVLAAIIEKVTGLGYGGALKQRIFVPLQMDHSGFNAYVKEETGKATGYLSNQMGAFKNNLGLHVIGAGDGGIYSSTGDLWKFIHSFLTDTRLLSNEYKLQEVNSPLFPVTFATWSEFLQKGKQLLAGGAPGISAVIGFNMEKNYSVIVLSNFDERTAEGMTQRISAVLNDRKPEPFQLPPAKFIYTLLTTKGASYFLANYKRELADAHISMEDDMNLLYAGRQLLKDKNADASIALYTVYTNEFPNIVVAWNDMGDAYLLKGDKEQARKCFKQVLVLRPANERARQALQSLQ